MTAVELKQKIDKFSEQLNEYGVTNFNGKVLWQIKNELGEYFRGISFASASEKEVLQQELERLSILLHEKQDQVNSYNEAFAASVLDNINLLISTYGDNLFLNNPEKEVIYELKALIDKIFDQFKQARWPSKEKRTELWDKFSSTREKIKKDEDEFYKELKQKKAEKEERSHQITQKIIETINACHPEATNEVLFTLSKDLKAFLLELGYTKESILLDNLNEEEAQKTTLKPKSETLRDLRRFLNENREEVSRDDKQKIFTLMDFINAELSKAWDSYRESLQKKQEEWEERKKIQEVKRQEWELKQKDFLQTLIEKLEKKTVDKTNLERIWASKKDFLTRQLTRLGNQQDFLKKMNEDLADMDEKVNTAWTDTFKERMSSKIEQKKMKINEVNGDILTVKEKIKEVENDIEEIGKKIELIEKGVTELSSKIEEIKKSIYK